jgi:hypothetical protein
MDLRRLAEHLAVATASVAAESGLAQKLNPEADPERGPLYSFVDRPGDDS